MRVVGFSLWWNRSIDFLSRLFLAGSLPPHAAAELLTVFGGAGAFDGGFDDGMDGGVLGLRFVGSWVRARASEREIWMEVMRGADDVRIIRPYYFLRVPRWRSSGSDWAAGYLRKLCGQDTERPSLTLLRDGTATHVVVRAMRLGKLSPGIRHQRPAYYGCRQPGYEIVSQARSVWPP